MRYVFCKYILSVCDLSSHSLDMVFCKSFKFNQIELSMISFMGCAYGIVSKKELPCLRSSRFFPILSSKSFTILHFICRHMIHFELIFVKGKSLYLNLFFFASECPTVIAPFIEKTIFASLDCICSFLKD